MLRVLSVLGTRPEAIKLAPVIRELERHPAEVQALVCATGQHREMLDQVLGLFGIEPDVDLDLMEQGQSPASLTALAVTAVTDVLRQTEPDIVLVQGDTTTAMVASLAAFYEMVAVGHVEAGLRTRNRYSPFPEEMNRRLIGVLATYHFAPTKTAAEALQGEGVAADSVFVTGNTVIDALHWTVGRPPADETVELLASLGFSRIHRADKREGAEAEPLGQGSVGGEPPVILVTAHRRENFGVRLEQVCTALVAIAQRNKAVRIVFPVHLNPQVRRTVKRLLVGRERIHLLDPLPYSSFAHLMQRSYLILTDSGGIQEEAPALGKPVLVLRDQTERPEAVKAGAVRVIGTNADRIVAETERLLRDGEEYRRMARTVSPYGDGHAARRITSIILSQMAQA